MKKFFNDFKTFINRGNILDLAIAVSVGTAFTKIAASLVNDLVMPFISLVIGQKHFTDWKLIIKEATETTAEVSIKYGNFIQTVFEFFIIAFSIFVIFRIIRKSRERLLKLNQQIFNKEQEKAVQKNEEKQEEVKKEIMEKVEEKQNKSEELLTEIRDLLKNQKDGK